MVLNRNKCAHDVAQSVVAFLWNRAQMICQTFYGYLMLWRHELLVCMDVWPTVLENRWHIKIMEIFLSQIYSTKFAINCSCLKHGDENRSIVSSMSHTGSRAQHKIFRFTDPHDFTNEFNNQIGLVRQISFGFNKDIFIEDALDAQFNRFIFQHEKWTSDEKEKNIAFQAVGISNFSAVIEQWLF